MWNDILKPVTDLVKHYIPASRRIRKEREAKSAPLFHLAKESFDGLKDLGWSDEHARNLSTAVAFGITENALLVLEKAQQISESPDFKAEFAKRLQDDLSVIGPTLEAAKFTSRDELRDLLGRILAGEVDKPGSFSRQTVTIAQNLTTENLHEFLKLRAVSWRLILPEGGILCFAIGERTGLYSQEFLSFNWEK